MLVALASVPRICSWCLERDIWLYAGSKSKTADVAACCENIHLSCANFPAHVSRSDFLCNNLIGFCVVICGFFSHALVSMRTASIHYSKWLAKNSLVNLVHCIFLQLKSLHNLFCEVSYCRSTSSGTSSVTTKEWWLGPAPLWTILLWHGAFYYFCALQEVRQPDTYLSISHLHLG